MQIKPDVNIQEIYARITQLERRFDMDWYDKDQLLDDLFKLRETIRTLAKKHEEIKSCSNDYNTRIDQLVDQLT